MGDYDINLNENLDYSGDRTLMRPHATNPSFTKENTGTD